MRSTRSLPCALLGLTLAACGGGGSGGSADPSTDSLTAAVEEGDRVDTRRADHEPELTLPRAQPQAGPAITILRIDGGDAEDGAGNVVHAAQRVAIDLDAHAFPPRALDPVLSVGTLRFVHYSHPRAGVLRFTIDDVSRLAIGAEISVQYGGDTASRRVLIQALSPSDLEGVTP
jgi:hypothetical protein